MDQSNSPKNTEVVFKQQYFTDKLSSFAQLLLISAVIIIILLFMISYIYFKEPEPKYFFTYSNGQIFQSQPLDQRLYSDAQIKDWAAQAAIRAFDYNFLNYKHQLANNSSLFTNEGHARLMQQISDRFLASVIQGKFSSKLSLCDVATIDKTFNKVFNVDGVNKFVWLVTLPVYIELKNDKEDFTIVAKVITKIVRVSDLEYLGGLAIMDISVVDPIATRVARVGQLPVCNNNYSG